MPRLTWRTTEEELKDVKIGDSVSDGFSIQGTVKKIEREDLEDGFIYYFHLVEGGKVTVLR